MGILTEEELTTNERLLFKSFRAKAIYETDHNLIDDIITSHRAIQERNRNLVLENDELLAENTKLKHAAIKVKQHLEGVTHPKRLIMLDCPWMVQTLNKALEETK